MGGHIYLLPGNHMLGNMARIACLFRVRGTQSVVNRTTWPWISSQYLTTLRAVIVCLTRFSILVTHLALDLLFLFGQSYQHMTHPLVLNLFALFLRHILQISRDHPAEGMEVWLTTGQMGFAVEREEDELGAEEDLAAQIPTSRYLEPQNSAFIQRLRVQGTTTMPADIWEALEDLEDTWGRGDEEAREDKRLRKRVWEKSSCPLAMQDPRYLPEVGLPQQLGKNWFLNDELPRTNTGAGYVRVRAEAMPWEEPAGRFQVLVAPYRVWRPSGVAQGLHTPPGTPYRA